ncbi:jg16108 [Pararge aegeria aegeria]|uniref:Jg16108 protein n=1 Tax=Pararge aegeria aegeria TaxID=348720 RepID=A0A8S4RV75_9NEOP|nr:jg16108 [Pararge aegeria aegeria]
MEPYPPRVSELISASFSAEDDGLVIPLVVRGHIVDADHVSALQTGVQSETTNVLDRIKRYLAEVDGYIVDILIISLLTNAGLYSYGRRGFRAYTLNAALMRKGGLKLLSSPVNNRVPRLSVLSTTNII